jgi:hypothetical protein
MTYHPIPKPASATLLTSLRRPTPHTETAPAVLDLNRRLQFAQRLAMLIRRIQAQPHVQAQEERSDES